MKKSIKLDKAHLLINHGPVVLITSHDGKKANIMTLAWTTPLNWAPPTIGVVIGDQAYSKKVILRTKQFVVNIPTEKILKETVYCGSVSGKNFDKFAKSGLTQYPAKKVKVPLIKECVGHLECRVVKVHKFGDASLIVGRVLAASADDGLFDDRLKVEDLRAKTVHHLGGSYFSVPGKVVSERS